MITEFLSLSRTTLYTGENINSAKTAVSAWVFMILQEVQLLAIANRSISSQSPQLAADVGQRGKLSR